MIEYKVVTAQCLCGRHAFVSSVPRSLLPLKSSICHCYGCRHVSGALGLPNVIWPSASIPDISGLARYDFSPRVWIYFCGTCGTYFFWHYHDETDQPGTPAMNTPGKFLVNVGVLDKPDEVVEINQHICVQGTRDGGAADFLPLYQDKPLPRWKALALDAPKDLSDLLPIGWRLQPENGMAEDEHALKANCLCKGVEFYVTRPSTVTTPGVKEGDEWWRFLGDRFPAGQCVCSYCRLAAGADVMHWCFVPRLNLKLMDGSTMVKPDFGTLKTYRSSDEASRQFCSRCGCVVFYAADDRSGLFDVAVGLFSSSSGARAEDWLAWRSWNISWAEDAVHTRHRDALVSGLRSWGERQPAGSFQALDKEPSLVAFRGLIAASSIDKGGQ